MAAERGGPGYAKIKAEFLKINHSNGKDNNNDNYFKNAKMLSDEITTKWKNKEPVPVEYLATRALRKLSVIFVKEVPPKETKTEETSADNMAQTEANDISQTTTATSSNNNNNNNSNNSNNSDHQCIIINNNNKHQGNSNNNNNETGKRDFKRKKGMNRARSKKEMGLETSNLNNNLCRQFCKIGKCDFGKDCKYDHDIAKYRELKPPDLGSICYLYEKYGHCPEGFNCRFASHHSDWDNFKQKVRSEEEGGKLPIPENLNLITTEIRDLLRRNQYPYKEVKKLKSDTSSITTTTTTTNDSDNNNNDSSNSSNSNNNKINNQHPQVGLSTIDKEWKKVDFKRKCYVAPLTTVGNLPFRRIVKEFGADITCGEMALSFPLKKGQNSEWALLRRHKSEDVFGVQIAGNKRDIMGKLSQVIENETQVDFIDLNLGCPIDVVCNRGLGAAMMNRPNQLLHVLEEMGPNISCPITVKMRAGWTRNHPSAHKLVHKLQLWNSQLSKDPLGSPLINGIAIHGRSRLQRYTKAADWNYIRQCRIVQNSKLPSIPIIGNGDVYNYEDWEKNLQESGTETVLLARGVLQKPWLCTEIKEKRHWDISATERLDIYKKFVHHGLEHWGSDQRGVNKVRRFLLEWLSFTYRYIPVGLLERIPVKLNERAPNYYGRNDLETLMASPDSSDWIKISEILLGKTPEGFKFVPKHRANAYDDAAERDNKNNYDVNNKRRKANKKWRNNKFKKKKRR